MFCHKCPSTENFHESCKNKVQAYITVSRYISWYTPVKSGVNVIMICYQNCKFYVPQGRGYNSRIESNDHKV